MNQKSTWRDLLDGINVHEIGLAEALKRLCTIGIYEPVSEFRDSHDEMEYESSLYGRIAEILRINCDPHPDKEKLAEIVAHLNNGKSVEEIAFHCFRVPIPSPTE